MKYSELPHNYYLFVNVSEMHTIHTIKKHWTWKMENPS